MSDQTGNPCQIDLIAAARFQARARGALGVRGLAPDTIPGYTIQNEIHRGGQGVVFLAIQNATQRTVALKVLHEGPFATHRDRLRFEREVQILAQLRHPNIVTIHDSGSVGSRIYHVMDYIEGRPLDEYAKEECPSLRRLLLLVAEVASAVNAAHLRGVIHRDLKPSNILIDKTGTPHVLDFGLAKIDEDDHSDHSAVTRMTMTGVFVGSLPWASPEQAEGKTDEIDIRTDVYSLGVLLYQLLADRMPYETEGPIREVLDRIITIDPPAPSTCNSEVDNEVDTIVLKCLSKSRERRYQAAGDLARDLRRYLAGEPIEAKRDSPAYMARKLVERHRLPVAVGSGLVSLVLLLSIAMAIGYERQLRVAVKNRESTELRFGQLQRDFDDLSSRHDAALMQLESMRPLRPDNEP